MKRSPARELLRTEGRLETDGRVKSGMLGLPRPAVRPDKPEKVKYGSGYMVPLGVIIGNIGKLSRRGRVLAA